MSKFKKIILRITILTTASIFSTTSYAMKKNSNVNNFLSHPYGPLHLNYDIEKLIDLNSLGLDNEVESCFDSMNNINISKIFNNNFPSNQYKSQPHLNNELKINNSFSNPFHGNNKYENKNEEYNIEKLIDLNSPDLNNKVESLFDSISKISNNIQNDNNLSNFFSDDLSEISNINNNLNKVQTINDKIIPDVIEVNNNNSNEIKNNKNKTSKKSLLNKKRKNK